MLKYFAAFIFIFLLLACNKKSIQSNSQANDRASELKARKFLDSLVEPHIKIIPDSMKKWIPVYDSIRNRDQRFRSIADPTLLAKHKTEQAFLDSINLTIVLKWLDQYGYPEPKLAGLKGILAIKMVLQHAPLKVQEKYYLVTAKAYSEGKAAPETLALLEDRINIRNRRVQFYGTQLIMYKKQLVPYPVHNIDSIDIYRKQIGMPNTFSQYLQTAFKKTFDVAKYKADLEGLKKFVHLSDTPAVRYVGLKDRLN